MKHRRLVFSEVDAQRCYVKKMFLRISKNPHENTCARVSFLIKLQAAACNIIKKRLWRRCFPVNFAKFLRTPLQNTSWRLLQLIDSLFQSFRYKQVFNFFCELVKFLNMCTLQEPSNSQFMFHCSLTSHILILVVCCKNPRRVARTPL